jgi:hypothetical protein
MVGGGFFSEKKKKSFFVFVSTIKAKSALPDNLSDLISLKKSNHPLHLYFSHFKCGANSSNQNIKILYLPTSLQ